MAPVQPVKFLFGNEKKGNMIGFLFSFWINILLTRLGQDLTISKRGLRRPIFSIENHINIHYDASQGNSTF
jgi:hypothetical protein